MNYRKFLLPAILRRLFCLCLITFISSSAFTQSAPLRVPLKVSQASLPITIGVPISEAAELRSTAKLTLLDPSGNAVALQTRVLARWRGTAKDESKALKWVLLDFTPKVAGNYTLTDAGVAAPLGSSIAITQTTDKISVASTQVRMEFARKGNALMSSFKLDSVEQLTAPVTVQGLFPRSAMVVLTPTSSDTLTVNETSLLTPGMQVRFEHSATIKWPVEKTWTSVWSADTQLRGNHRYLLDEGTPQQEELLCTKAEYGTLKLAAPLKFSHPAGAKLRDLTVEQETATIKSINGQSITFTEPLKQTHITNDCLRADNSVPATALAMVENTIVEEANALQIGRAHV